jgi:hypothetical protein
MGQTELWVTGVHGQGKNRCLNLTVIEVLEGIEIVS